MRKFIGAIMTKVGATLWEAGGFWKAERYEDLSRTGKFGYNLMCTGLQWQGLTIADVEAIVSTN